MLSTPQAATLYDVLQAELNALIAHYKAAMRDGMTVAEIWELVNNAVAAATRVVHEAQTEYGGKTKQEVVLHFAETFYDEVLGPYDLPRIPNILETRFVDPAIKHFYMLLIEGAINSLVNVANRTGWSDVPQLPPDGGTPPITPVPGTPAGFIPY